LKAFLRIGKPVDMPAKTIMDDLESAAAQVQGALKAGSFYMTAYFAYIFEVYRIMKRWSRFKVKLEDRHVMMAMIPVAFGGLSVKSLPQIATNESFHTLAASIGNCKAFVHRYRANLDVVNRLLSARMKESNAEMFVKAPRSIRSEVESVNVMRFNKAMKQWLMRNARNPYITSVLAVMRSDSSSEMLIRTRDMKEISTVGLMTIKAMQPAEAVDSLINKLQRSDTAVELLGFRAAIRISLANRFEAARLIKGYGLSRGEIRVDIRNFYRPSEASFGK